MNINRDDLMRKTLKVDWSENESVDFECYYNRLRNAPILLDMVIDMLNSNKEFMLVKMYEFDDPAVKKLVNDRFVRDWINTITNVRVHIMEFEAMNGEGGLLIGRGGV
jgi:hypothetical protein